MGGEPSTATVAATSDDQRAFVNAIRDFCEREAQPARLRAIRAGDGSYDRAAHEAITQLGWMGTSVAERYGGAGLGRGGACILLGEVVRGGLPLLGLASTLVVIDVVQSVGSNEQKETILPDVCEGAVASIAMSEPEAGSDVAALSCSATKVPGGFVVDGHKTWISAAHVADHVLVVARTDRVDSKQDGLSMFWIPTDHGGVEIRTIDTLAGGEVNDVYLTDCSVPESALVGERGKAWPALMRALELERVLIAAAMLGLAQAAFSDAVSYVNQRRQFGRSIGSFQVIRHRIADMATELECCSLLLCEAMRSLDDPEDRAIGHKAALAKLKVTETAKRITLEGMQMMGGTGYASDSDMQHRVRMALGSTIYGGTSEIQREIIARRYA